MNISILYYFIFLIKICYNFIKCPFIFKIYHFITLSLFLLSFQILVYPIIDLAGHYKSDDEFKSNCFLLTPEMMKIFIKNYLEDPEITIYPDVNPLFMKDFTNLPKTLIIGPEI